MVKLKTRHFEAFADARTKRTSLKVGSEPYELATVEMWEATYAALSGTTQVTLQPEMAQWLHYNIGQLLANRKPDEMQALLHRGGASQTDALKDAELAAVLYLQATSLGHTKDAKPIKTLSLKFGCSRQTITTWQKNGLEDAWASWRPMDCDDITTKLKYLKIKVREAARHYTQESKSAKARENKKLYVKKKAI